MLTTDAYAFLDIHNPICAWGAYRGALITPPDGSGFVSTWTAGLLGRSDPGRIALETALEECRATNFPDRRSRLRGLFCFPDRKSAEAALEWGDGWNHFEEPLLAELSLAKASAIECRMDANWITNAPIDADGIIQTGDWMWSYWKGEAYPSKAPIWEAIVEGEIIVLGTDVRDLAYETVKGAFPESLCFLEISRVAALLGSNLGAIMSSLSKEEEAFTVMYSLDFRDAKNPDHLEKVRRYIADGGEINRADMDPFFDRDTFGNLPDLRTYQYSKA